MKLQFKKFATFLAKKNVLMTTIATITNWVIGVIYRHAGIALLEEKKMIVTGINMTVCICTQNVLHLINIMIRFIMPAPGETTAQLNLKSTTTHSQHVLMKNVLNKIVKRKLIMNGV